MLVLPGEGGWVAGQSSGLPATGACARLHRAKTRQRSPPQDAQALGRGPHPDD